MRRSGGHGFTLIELLVVVGILAVIISFLLPALSQIRSARQQREQRAAREADPAAAMQAGIALDKGPNAGPAAAANPAALVRSFTAKVDLTPRLSVGTVEPESIYEAKLTTTVTAVSPNSGAGPCEIRLPLPPQIISLADLSVTVNGEPSDAVSIRDAAVVWTGSLPADAPAPVVVTYTAVGKGLYELQTPPGKILDTFDLELAANGSDVRMLDLSLQPTGLSRGSGRTTYAWNYKRLVFGRPIAVDVLGVAPVDRLGELRWLGPLSVCVLGLIVGLYAHAFGLVRFDRWMLLLVLGAFTGAYPLMYFAQEFVPLTAAVATAAGAMIAVIAVRTVTAIGLRHALLGVVLPAVATMALTLTVATRPHLQGILLTAGAIVVFVVAMVLAPKLRWPEPPAAPRGPALQPA